MIELNKIFEGDALNVLTTFESESVNCIVTSPPYYGLRDYGVIGQAGLEKTPEEYIKNQVLIFREAKRVLRNDGTLWLNIGDTYAAYWGQKYGQGQSLSGTRENNGSAPPAKMSPVFSKSKRDVKRYGGGNLPASGDIKPKDLFGIPWMLAFALRADGWYLRQDIIWHKPNPMPESVTDRCTKSHEYIFLLSKSPKYYYDAEALKTEIKDSSVARLGQDIENQEGSSRVPGKTNGTMKAVRFGGAKGDGNGTQGIYSGKEWTPKQAGGSTSMRGHSGNFKADGTPISNGKANKRSVWTVTTKPFSEAHFATFPEDLITDCIKAGCPEGGTVLDPFMGAGTTALVARKLNRNFVGIELNPAYIQMAETRLKKELGMFI